MKYITDNVICSLALDLWHGKTNRKRQNINGNIYGRRLTSKDNYPLRLVLGLLPAARPVDTERVASFLPPATMGFSSFLDCVFLDAGAFQ